MLSKLELRDRHALASWRPEESHNPLGAPLPAAATPSPMVRLLPRVGTRSTVAGVLAGVAAAALAAVVLVVVGGDGDSGLAVAPTPTQTSTPAPTPTVRGSPATTPTPTVQPRPKPTRAAGMTATPGPTPTAAPSPTPPPSPTPAPVPAPTPPPSPAAAPLPTREGLGIREVDPSDPAIATWSAPTWYEAGADVPWRASVLLLDVGTGAVEAWRHGSDPGPAGYGPRAVSPSQRFLIWPGRLHDRESGRWYAWDASRLLLDRTWGTGSGEHLLFQVVGSGDYVMTNAEIEPVARVALPPGERFTSARGGYIVVRECVAGDPGDRFHVVDLDVDAGLTMHTWTLPWKTTRRPGRVCPTPYDLHLLDESVAIVGSAGSDTCRVVRYDLTGSPLSDVELACPGSGLVGRYGYAPAVSPDGRMIVTESVKWVAGSWDVILVISDTTTGEPILRVTSIWPGRHGAGLNGSWREIHLDDIWLADSSGIVVVTPRGPRIVTLGGAWEWAPGRPSAVDADLFYSVFDAPPAVMNGAGEVLASVSFGPDGPPLGSYPLSGAYRGCYLGTRADWGAAAGTVRIRPAGGCAPEWPTIVVGAPGPPLAPVIERPPFGDRVLVEVAVDTCLNVREDHSVDASAVACLPDGTIAEPDDVVRAWMHIRTGDGVEGWAHADYLRWHSDGVRLDE